MKQTGTTVIRRTVQLALLAAVTLLFSFLPIRTLGLEITLAMVPIAVGAALLGPAAGAFLGGWFGLISFLQCVTGYSAFGAVLLGISPWRAFVMCVPTRILVGLLGGVAARLAQKGGSERLAALLCAVLTPLCNTLFFMTALVLGFYSTEYIQSFVRLLGAVNPFAFVVLFVGINGLVELIAGAVVAYPATRALHRALRRWER